MIMNPTLLKPHSLWKKIIEQSSHALACGAMQSLPTELEFVEQDGIQFLVRILSNFERKQKQSTRGKEFNPFLPYEEDLFVADISDTHLCILNKFNVVDYHLLIITRAFEEQESLLNLEDFTALWACLAEFRGLGFYNGGKIAGASQRHKHLQLIPVSHLPIEPLLAAAKFENAIATLPRLPFVHAFTTLEPADSAESLLERYHKLLAAVGLGAINHDQQSGAYNLLVTSEWMLIIPRSQAEFASIAVNSLGFAGILLVRNQEQMQVIKHYQPMTILKNVAVELNPN